MSKKQQQPKQQPKTTPPRTFRMSVTKIVEVRIDPYVIEQGLRADNPILGPGATEDHVLEHLAFNLVGNEMTLTEIDGYANLADEMVHLGTFDHLIEVEEIGHKIRGRR